MREAVDRQGGRTPPIQTSLLPRGRGERPRGHGLVPTRALAAHRSAARLLRMVRAVRLLFPELGDASIRVGLTRAASGYASLEGRTIWVNPYRLSRHTIAHELVHLLQSRGVVPGGEKTADLHALARHETLADDLPGDPAVPDGRARRGGRGGPAGPLLL